MEYRGTHGDAFGVCNFCDTDSSGHNVKFVYAVGDKGICDRCAKALGEAINRAEGEK